jgi:hypothetical protein
VIHDRNVRPIVPAGLLASLSAWILLFAACGDDDNGGVRPDASAATDAPAAATNDAGLTDGATDLDGGTGDAGPRCDPKRPFGVPTPLTSVNTAAEEHDVHLSPDELTIYITVREDEDGGQYDLFTASRPSETASFGNRERLGGINDPPTADLSPSVSDNGLWVVYASSRDGGLGGTDLWRATRPNPGVDFDQVRLVASVNSAATETDPWVLPNALYFATNRGSISSSIFRTSFTQNQAMVVVGTPGAVPGLANGGTADDFAPVVAGDERTIFFGTSRNAAAKADIFTATRDSATAAFDPPTRVEGLSSPSSEFPTWLSADGCRIYFVSDRPFGGGGGLDAWFATRPR